MAWTHCVYVIRPRRPDGSRVVLRHAVALRPGAFQSGVAAEMSDALTKLRSRMAGVGCYRDEQAVMGAYLYDSASGRMHWWTYPVYGHRSHVD